MVAVEDAWRRVPSPEIEAPESIVRPPAKRSSAPAATV